MEQKIKQESFGVLTNAIAGICIAAAAWISFSAGTEALIMWGILLFLSQLWLISRKRKVLGRRYRKKIYLSSTRCKRWNKKRIKYKTQITLVFVFYILFVNATVPNAGELLTQYFLCGVFAVLFALVVKYIFKALRLLVRKKGFLKVIKLIKELLYKLTEPWY